jgi:predicted glycoside hydrolase/deacetylase ChbG (UPF0249 family)
MKDQEPMDDRRVVIVNADDLGRTRSINAGIARAHEEGILTSASLMVRWPAAREAVPHARAHPELSVGLHADLAEWVPRSGRWVTVYEIVDLEDDAAVSRELHRQLESFRRMIGRDPTHLDSHQHIHRQTGTQAFAELASALGVPLREFDPVVTYCGAFYGQTPEGDPLPGAVTPDRLIDLLGDLGPGVTELSCHPGAGRDGWSIYEHERTTELETLCDPRVRAAIEEQGIVLASFADLRVV